MAGPNPFDYTLVGVQLFVDDNASEREIDLWNEFLDSIFTEGSYHRPRENLSAPNLVDSVPTELVDQVEMSYANSVFEITPLGFLMSNRDEDHHGVDYATSSLSEICEQGFKDYDCVNDGRQFVRNVSFRNDYLLELRHALRSSRHYVSKHFQLQSFEQGIAYRKSNYLHGDLFKLKVKSVLSPLRAKHFTLGKELFLIARRTNLLVPWVRLTKTRKGGHGMESDAGDDRMSLVTVTETGYDIDCRNTFLIRALDLFGPRDGKLRFLQV